MYKIALQQQFDPLIKHIHYIYGHFWHRVVMCAKVIRRQPFAHSSRPEVFYSTL